MVWPVHGQMNTSGTLQDRFSTINDIYFDSHTNRYWYAGSNLMDRPCTWEETLYTIRKLNDTRKNGCNN
jgi:hypothetical protein